MTVRLDSGDRVSLDVRDHELVMPHLGYAATTHSTQGATVDRCFVLCGGSMQDREATYVQASRAREETRLYINRVSAGEEFGNMIPLKHFLEGRKQANATVPGFLERPESGQYLDPWTRRDIKRLGISYVLLQQKMREPAQEPNVLELVAARSGRA